MRRLKKYLKWVGIAEYFKIQTSKIGRCTYPFADCRQQPINAHSIQNATAFELLHINNHVISIRQRFDPSGKPVPGFHPIGRNEASTFLGLCAEHDNFLFTKIDKHPFNAEDNEYLFLLAYRSLLRENHASTSSFIRVQQMYLDRIKDGMVPGEHESIESLPIEFGIKAYGVHLFKEEIDQEFQRRNFDYLRHFVLRVETNRPTIACSHVFVVDRTETDEAIHLFVNIFPTRMSETVVVFSVLSRHANVTEDYLNRCFTGNASYNLYEVSKLVLRKCENLFISPSLYNDWTEFKKRKILDLFSRNIGAEVDDDSPEYYLF